MPCPGNCLCLQPGLKPFCTICWSAPRLGHCLPLLHTPLKVSGPKPQSLQVSRCRAALEGPCEPCSEHSLPMPGHAPFRPEQGGLQSLGCVRHSARTLSPAHTPLGSPSTDPSTGWLCTSALTPRHWDSACGCTPACSRLGEHRSHFPHVTAHSLGNLPPAHALQVDETTLLPLHLATLISLFQLL